MWWYRYGFISGAIVLSIAAINSPCHGQNRKGINIGFFVIILGAIFASLIYSLIRAARHRRAARTGFFKLIAPHLGRLRRTITASGFERLSGQVNNAEIDLQIINDTLTYRKLPCFWLLVSHIEPLPLTQKISLMSRPTGFESFSVHTQLPCQTVQLPASFPHDMALRSERPLNMQEMGLLRRHVGIFKNTRIKELLLTPQGVRLTWLVEEANRGRYLLFREAELSCPPLEWSDFFPLLENLADLRHDIGVAFTKEEEQKCA